jgi:hypothetical protein
MREKAADLDKRGKAEASARAEAFQWCGVHARNP